MTTLEAIYENGIFKPVSRVPETLKENERVRIIIETDGDEDLRAEIEQWETASDEDFVKVEEMTDYSDDEVLALANMQMPEKQSERHSELLYKNQAGTLTAEEKRELDFFQQIYGVALSRRTDGIFEAIKRKLIKSPADLMNE